MFTSITVGRLYVGSVFKLIGIGLTCCFVPLSLLAGALAMFGLPTLTWNARPIAGAWGLALYPVFGLFLTLVLTFVVGTACVAGLWLYARFRPLMLWGRDVAVEPPARNTWIQGEPAFPEA